MSFTALSLGGVLALLPARPSIPETLQFSLLGFIVVMLVLTLMFFGAKGLGQIFIRIDKRAAAQKSAEEEHRRKVAATAAAIAVAQPAPATAGQSGDDPVLVAVIAAAARVVLGKSARVVSIRQEPNVWGAEGRRQIFDSHRVR